MSRVTEIRKALAALAGPDSHVTPATADYSDAAPDRLAFAVTVATGPISPEAEQRLDDLLDPDDGLKAILEADRRLGGLVSDVSVAKSSGYVRLPGEPVELLGTTWIVACLL